MLKPAQERASESRPGSAPFASWFALGVIIVAVLLAYLDRQIMVLVVEPLKRDLHLSDLQIGSVQGIGPALLAVVAGFPLALLADRYDRRWVFCGAIIFWSAAMAAIGFAQSFTQLLLFSVALAIGESVLTPIMYSLIPDLFAGRQREFANLVMMAALKVGVGLALMLGGAMVALAPAIRRLSPPGLQHLSDWRLIFLALAVGGILVALLVLAIRPRPKALVVGAADFAGSDRFLPFVRRHWVPFGLVYGGAGLWAFAMSALSVWLPVALIREFGAQPADVGVRFGSSFSIGGAIGVFGAMLTLPLWRKWGGRTYVLRSLGVCVAVAAIGVGGLWLARTPNEIYAILGVVFVALFCGTAFTPTMLQDMAPPHLRARTTAVAMIIYTAIGSSAPMIVGALSDRQLFATRPLLATVIVCTAASLLAAAAIYRVTEKPFARLLDDIAAGDPDPAEPEPIPLGEPA